MKARRIGQAVEDAANALDAAGVGFGHGTTDAGQEALWLASHVLGLSWEALHEAFDHPVSAAHESALRKLVLQRIATRKPAAYLLNEAWLGPHKFYVDERVIVPRSFIAELLRQDRFGEPNNQGRTLISRKAGNEGPSLIIGSVLDLCTGSGCLAILAALAFPEAKVDAVDLSAEALEVARRNVDDYGLGGRVELVRSDMFAQLGGRRYDLILSNPPYVKAAAMRTLPEEYRREPRMALASGTDGLDHARVILAEARRHLNPGGRLVVEIGHNRQALEKAFPGLAFEWPKTSAGRQLVFALPAAALP